MADYSHQNEGVGGKGIFVGILLICLFIAGLAFLGSGGSETGPGTAPGELAAPAAAPETTAPVATD